MTWYGQKWQYPSQAWTSSSVSDARLHILLAEKYANESRMGRQTLVGGDAHLWRHLEPVIMQLGLHVLFADIEVKIEGTASVDSGEGDDPWDAIGEDDFYFNMEDQLGDGYGELKVMRTWSIDGKLLDVPNADFAIQDLVEEEDVQVGIVRFGEDERKFNRNEQWRANMTYIYRRTVLVLCKDDAGFVAKDENTLGTSTLKRPATTSSGASPATKKIRT